MKTKKHIFAFVVSLALVFVAAFCVGCTQPEEEGNTNPKSYSFEGVLAGEKDMPAFLELKEDGTVKLEYIMTMGAPNNTTHTLVTDKGSWTQNDSGVITSVTLESNGDDYNAVISADEITIGYSLDFTTFTVSVADVKENGGNFVFRTSELPKSFSYEGVVYAEQDKEMPAFLELKEDGTVQLEYIMTMGNPDNTSHTVITNQGSWTQDVLGRVDTVKLISNGDEYEAVVNKKTGTITIGYSVDFSTFTVSVDDVKTDEGSKNIVISTAD